MGGPVGRSTRHTSPVEIVARIGASEARSITRTRAGLTGELHPSTHVNDTIDDIYRMASALLPV
jgi:hypothetical protein